MGLCQSSRAVIGALLLTRGLQFAHTNSDPYTIVFGAVSRPCGDMTKQAIAPTLKEKGYRVVVREFSDCVQPGVMLPNNSVDASLSQHLLYSDRFTADKDLKLSKLVMVPTAGMGSYSHKIKNPDELEKGDVITLPNDLTNLARGLCSLQSIDLITIRDNINPTRASERDITSNPKGLVFKLLEATQLPHTLGGVTGALVSGNFAMAAKMDSASVIKQERLNENLKNIIAVRSEDADKLFAKDIVEMVRFPAYHAVIDDLQNIYNTFQEPEWVSTTQ